MINEHDNTFVVSELENIHSKDVTSRPSASYSQEGPEPNFLANDEINRNTT
jgi:hypothetical protein